MTGKFPTVTAKFPQKTGKFPTMTMAKASSQFWKKNP